MNADGNHTTQQKITLILFGATGDLSRTKLLPGLARLLIEQPRLDIHCVAVGRKPLTTEEYLVGYLSDDIRETLTDHLSYLQADISSVEELDTLPSYLESLKRIQTDYLFYFATPTRFYYPVSEKLKELGLTQNENGFVRAIYEKPFGNSLEDAKDLLLKIQKTFSEEQLFFVDHYLGKEIVQDVVMTKLFNPLYAASLHHHYVESIEIILSEQETIGTRGQYYDKVGVIRDMVQNHMVQLSALLCLDLSSISSQEEIASAKQEALSSLQLDTTSTPLVGQYQGYLTEEHISSDSSTPTFVAVTLQAQSGPLKGVLLHLRTGKALDTKYGLIRVHYKQRQTTIAENAQPNTLVFHIQPEVKLEACINVRKNQISSDVQQETTSLCNLLSRTQDPREAYERLLFEVICGRKMLFAHPEEILSGWRIVQSIETVLTERSVPLHTYKEGSSVTHLIRQYTIEEK